MHPNTKHGHSSGKSKSGPSPEYACWNCMLDRCRNPNNKEYPRYGGRGITVFAPWYKFENFFAFVGPRPSPKHSLDRIDNNRGYEPGNIRWATKKEQQRNTRYNRIIPFRGRNMCVAEAAELAGLPHKRVRMRLDRGWSVERAMEAK